MNLPLKNNHMTRKAYISVPITGRPLGEAMTQAARLARRLHGHGWEPVSPFTVNPPSTAEAASAEPHTDTVERYAALLGRDIEALLGCDSVCFGRGWHRSRGCRLEMKAARMFDKFIIFL